MNTQEVLDRSTYALSHAASEWMLQLLQGGFTTGATEPGISDSIYFAAEEMNGAIAALTTDEAARRQIWESIETAISVTETVWQTLGSPREVKAAARLQNLAEGEGQRNDPDQPDHRAIVRHHLADIGLAAV